MDSGRTRRAERVARRGLLPAASAVHHDKAVWLEAVEARNAVQSLVQSPARIVAATETTLLDAYEISAAKNHDVRHAFLLALAREYDDEYLLTTDSDFETLCADEPITYTNPVPENLREKLALTNG